jgi:hypothetical protein
VTVDPRALFANHYAFLVGIDKYDHFRSLGGARNDAQALYEALHGIGYTKANLWLVPEDKTSQKNLQEQVEWFLETVSDTRQETSDPDIVVFWAGHGLPGDHSSYLLTRTTTRNLRNVEREAISLQDLARRFDRTYPASLTMFFDVCHSIARDSEYLLDDPESRLLTPMRDAVRRPRRWTFVGVSTWAYEVDLAPHHQAYRRGGILTDALQKGIRGEPCYSRDKQPCPAENCVVTVESLVSKLQQAVAETAAANDCSQRVSFLADQNSKSTLTPPTAIGLAVRSFADTRFREESLPKDTELLVKQVVEDSEAFLWP